MNGLTCANCNNLLREGDRFCARCSQNAATHKLTVPHLLHDLFHAVTHADKGIFSLIKQLATNPGKVAREYADGKRKKYFNPFTFLLICLSAFIIVNSIFHVIELNIQVDPNALASMPSEEARQNYIAFINRVTEMMGFVTQRSNIVYMVAIPFYSFIMWLFFRRRSYAEHLVASIYFNAFLTLVTSFVLAPILTLPALKGNLYLSVLFTSCLQIVYLTWAYNGFLKSQLTTPILKVIGAILVMLLSWIILTGIFVLIYVFRENAWTVVQLAISKWNAS